jgi:HEAT repeat protein
MLALLDSDLPTVQLRGAVLFTLGKSRDARAVAALTAHLEQDSWGDHLCQRALIGLAATRRPEVLETLLAYSAAHRAPRARGAAASALGSLGDTVPELRRAVCERLVEMLSEPGFRAQLGALSGLTTLKDPAALGALEKVRTTAPDGRTRRMAYEAQVRTRAGGSPEKVLEQLRAQLETLAEENRKLRGRVDKLERPL